MFVHPVIYGDIDEDEAEDIFNSNMDSVYWTCHRSNGVEIVAKGGRSCLHVAHMKEGDFGRITSLHQSNHPQHDDTTIISISIISISLMMTWSGQYTCEASNTLGSSKDSIIVVGQLPTRQQIIIQKSPNSIQQIVIPDSKFKTTNNHEFQIWHSIYPAGRHPWGTSLGPSGRLQGFGPVGLWSAYTWLEDSILQPSPSTRSSHSTGFKQHVL